MGEFELIARYFNRNVPDDTLIGIGDDCALFTIPDGMQLAQSMDTLVEGIHFPENIDPQLLGYRSLAVSISDLAAMGAKPHSFTLGLTLPDSNEQWLRGFSDGLFSLADSLSIPLIGGDTTRGPLTITIQVQGTVPQDTALRRNGAKAGDQIYVSGYLGDAAGALPYVLSREEQKAENNAHIQALLQRYYKPTPRLALGRWLRENGATAALDISDGLLGDLNHILSASHKGAELNLQTIPCSPNLTALYTTTQAKDLALQGGDDYELCFTWPKENNLILPSFLSDSIFVTMIGSITEQKGIRDTQQHSLDACAYTHF
ncbi:Thiamine-monophosphate kinase [invertebrate metagenome]|uniref:Thiamine-monophosphate kinase n=1 Tax=invertebrate metagenome TaxID=1711999 RepID=A0A2H9T8C3_9ZZZZ